jgi:diguanylate cyclase (GGDEF)-like protein
MEESSPEYRRGKEKILRWNGENEQVWEIHSFDDRYYQVSSYPINLQERRVFAHTVTDITEQKRRQLTLSNKAYIDPVTSLHNRLFFEEYIDGVMRDHRTVTLAYIDLDGLKFVNDHYGHGEGDRYLQTFAGLVRESFRSDDVFARIGGDEFCVVLEGSVCDLARRKLELIRSRMIDENTKEYPVSFSYGVREIVGSAADQPTLQAILRDVDNEMYQYKRKHKKQRAAV